MKPSRVAEIARGVYELRLNSVSEALKTGIGTDGMFSVDDGSTFTGKTGALLFKKLSTFGYVARGTGAFASEVLVANRGTDMVADWVTDANIGLQIGPSHHLVHAGFNTTWKGFVEDLRAFFRHNNPSRIHCVGYSLGGALATLNADFCTDQRIAEVVLYTFGCPRVGDGLFARSLTQRVGAANIHRVAHPADPVPMIPLFPFWHLPFGQAGLSIANGQGALVSGDAHKMRVSYIPGVRDHSWSTLAQAAVPADEERQVKAWLERAAEGRGGFVVGSARLLSMIGRALAWMMKAAGKALLGGLGVTLAVGCTVLDQMAWLLTRAAQLGKEMGLALKTLITAIFSFLGRKTVAAGEVTVAFLRWVLELLFGALRAAAQRALNLVA